MVQATSLVFPFSLYRQQPLCWCFYVTYGSELKPMTLVVSDLHGVIFGGDDAWDYVRGYFGSVDVA